MQPRLSLPGTNLTGLQHTYFAAEEMMMTYTQQVGQFNRRAMTNPKICILTCFWMYNVTSLFVHAIAVVPILSKTRDSDQ